MNNNQYRLLKSGVREWNQWRRENPYEVIDLRRADLRRADLRNADLRNAYLRNADLSDADLRDADLRDAYLTGAYLTGAKFKPSQTDDLHVAIGIIIEEKIKK